MALLGIPIDYVTIVQDDDRLGHTASLAHSSSLADELVMLFSGECAEAQCVGNALEVHRDTLRVDGDTQFIERVLEKHVKSGSPVSRSEFETNENRRAFKLITAICMAICRCGCSPTFSK
jgi:hypothetical protein